MDNYLIDLENLKQLILEIEKEQQEGARVYLLEELDAELSKKVNKY